MYWHIDADIITLVVICALYIYDIKLLPLKEHNNYQDKRFKECLTVGMGVTLIDIAASVIMEIPVSPLTYHVLMTLYYISIELLMLVWVVYSVSILYSDDVSRRTRVARISAIPFGLYSLLVLTNPWTGLFFTLGENNEYARGPLFFLMLVLYAVYAVGLLVLIVVRRRHIPQAYPRGVLLLIPLILAVAIPIQLMNGGWLMILPAYMICLVLAFLFFETSRTKSDREMVRQLNDLVEHFDAGFIICSISAEHDFKIEYINDVYFNMCEMDRETFMFRNEADPLHGIHPEDRAMVEQNNRLLTEEFVGYEMTFRFVTDSGRVVFLYGKAQVVVHEDGSAHSYSTFTDITEQIKLQKQFSDVILNVPCGICLFQWDGRNLSPKLTNARLSELLGEDAQRYLDSVEDLNYTHVHPEDLEMLKAESLKALNETHLIDITYRSLNFTTNQYMWIRMRGRMLPQADGTQLVFVSYNDVTQEHISEQMLRARFELEKNRPTLREDALIVHSLFNMSTGETLEYQYADGTDVPREDRTTFAEGRENIDRLIIDEKEREQYRALHNEEYLMRSFESGESEFVLDYRRRMPTGDVVWVRNLIHILRSPTSSDILVFEYWYNIEEERMLELMYRSLASDNYDFVARINGKTRAFVVMPKTGLTHHMPPLEGPDADEVSLTIYNDLVLPEDREMAIHNSLVENIKKNVEANGRFQFTYRVADGESVRYKRITQYYIDPQREIIIMTREDVTDLIRTETTKNDILAAALETANQASEAKSHFLSRVSHELRTPLNAIIGFIELARDSPPEQLQGYIANSDLAAKQLLSIINDVLDVSSIEAGKLKLAYAPFDFGQLVRFIDNIYVSQCSQKGLSFETQLLFSENTWLMGDRMRVTQILMNLLNNSVKFTEEGGIKLRISQTDVHGDTAFLRFEVLDTGCGMSEDMLGRLFNPFEQESVYTAQKYGGSGLGLSIVRSLVSMMNGQIRAESRLGEGSAFIVDLPFKMCEADSSALAAEELVSSAAPAGSAADMSRYELGGRRVLLAEDNAMNRMVAEGLVKRMGAECDCAEDGAVAVERFLGSDPGYYDAVLMDIQMPNMDGFEATRAIRRSGHPDAETIQIIALTANAFNEDIAKTLSSGMNAHVAKPIEPEVLAQTLEKAFRTKG